MEKPIYFSKVEYREYIGYGNVHSIILLNVASGELSYQVYNWTRQMPAIQGVGSDEIMDRQFEYKICEAARVIRNEQTNFEPQLIPSNQYESDIVFSFSMKFNESEMKELLSYCNALEFEPYRDRKMSMDDVGYAGYRDEVHMKFTAVTDSYIPKIELPMEYYYAVEYEWPSERLYRYLVRTYLENNKKLKGWGPSYGGHSLW